MSISKLLSRTFLADMMPPLCTLAFPPAPYLFSIDALPPDLVPDLVEARPTLTLPQSCVLGCIGTFGMVDLLSYNVIIAFIAATR